MGNDFLHIYVFLPQRSHLEIKCGYTAIFEPFYSVLSQMATAAQRSFPEKPIEIGIGIEIDEKADGSVLKM